MFVFAEIIEIIITIVFAGYILKPLTKGDLKDSFILAGLSIVAHELAHKFVGIASGFSAVYHANYSGLILGLVFRLMGFPVFMVPAYVSVSGAGSIIGFIFTALAGPLMNFVLFGIATLLLNNFNDNEWVQDHAEFINSVRVINLWLGIFNILPIPGTDGFNALTSLARL